MSGFPLVDQYIGVRLDADVVALIPGEPVVVESVRRLRPEQSFGYVHALSGIWFEDGRVVVSVPPGARDGIVEVLSDVQMADDRFDQTWLQRLKAPVDAALRRAGLSAVRNEWDAVCFACDAASLRSHSRGDCRRLYDESIPPVEGLCLPTHCFPDGVVYGVVEQGCIVAVAHAHRSDLMEGQIVDIGVETAEPYRRRGYAKTVVSTVTAHITRSGGEGVYSCGASNQASIATARSAGYELYGKGIVLATDIHSPSRSLSSAG